LTYIFFTFRECTIFRDKFLASEQGNLVMVKNEKKIMRKIQPIRSKMSAVADLYGP